MEDNTTAPDERKNLNSVETLRNNLFDLAKNFVNTSQKKIEEKNLIILGDKCSGKSVLFNTITQNSSSKSNYIPTCGINYSYMRYQPSTTKKLLLNIYEIGGGINNINLIKTVLNDKNLRNTIFLINLDLSRPREILILLKNYLKELKSIIKEIAEHETILDIVENKKSKYKDPNSNDFKRINIFPAEVIVIGNNYESLEVIDLEKIKWTCRCIRFLCHSNSLSIVFFKKSDTKIVKIFNNLIISLAYSTNGMLDSSTNFSQKNDILPLYILYSNDTFLDIGEPKVFQQGSKDIYSLWEDTLYSVFPKNSDSIEEKINRDFDLDQASMYKEPRLDEELKLFE